MSLTISGGYEENRVIGVCGNTLLTLSGPCHEAELVVEYNSVDEAIKGVEEFGDTFGHQEKLIGVHLNDRIFIGFGHREVPREEVLSRPEVREYMTTLFN